MKLTASLIALVASASAANYQWIGRPTNFNDADNWQPFGSASGSGVSPVGTTQSSQPSAVHLGSANAGSLTTSVDTGSYMVGSLIQFDGSATLVLGDGRAGSTTTLTFDTSNTRDANQIMFAADDEFDCSSNWQLSNGDEVDRTTTDCPVPTNEDNIVVGYRTGSNSDSMYALTFGASDSVARASGLQCGDDINFAANDNVMVMFQGLGCVRQTGGGGRGGCSLSADQCRDSDDQTNADIASATEAPTATPTAAGGGGGPDSSSASGEDNSDGSIIIIVVVVAIILILVVIGVVLYIVKNQGPSGTDDRGQVSFENPMYDNAGNPQQQQNATYSEPGGGSSGYMDVPANAAGGGGGSGYMDVAPGDGGGGGGGGGYMDVAPNQGATGYMDVSAGFEDDDAEDV